MKPITKNESSGYDIDALKEGIKKNKVNIKIFEEAIEKEKKQIETHKKIIIQLESRL